MTELEQIEQVLDEEVRPYLHAHGGEIVSLGFADGEYRFRLLGQCSGCPSAYLTTESVVAKALEETLPQVKQVILVQAVSDSLLEQARAILRDGQGPSSPARS